MTPPPPALASVTTRREAYASWTRPVFRAPDLTQLDIAAIGRRELAFAKPRFRASQRRR